jgi:L-fucose mutarotase
MLKGIHPALTPDLLWAIAAMGHGDIIAVVDANYPAYALHKRVLPLVGVDIEEAVSAITSVFPVDRAIEPAVFAMTPEGDLAAQIHSHTVLGDVLAAAEGRPVEIGPLERSEFYRQAKDAFAVVLTGETSSYACFLLTKGVVSVASTE